MNTDLDVFIAWQKDPALFALNVWNLAPQPLRPEYQAEFDLAISKNWEEWEAAKKEIKAHWFEPFIKGEHLTWQQVVLFECVKKAISGLANKKISIASGHGIGKSATVSILILWFLTVFFEAQVPVTAPTAAQMNDVLWKELAIWIGRMPKGLGMKFDWTSTHIRVTESPETWFARARTASKENSEALAGVHGEHVLLVADEASGVHEAVFTSAEGALTNQNILIILISNPTRAIGYFYDTHHKLAHIWQNVTFNSEDSPIVDKQFIELQTARHGKDSVEYGIRVLGRFPDADTIDAKGYVPYISDKHIVESLVSDFVGRVILAVDPSGEGQDKTSWCARDAFKARIVATEDKSSSKSIAQKTLTLAKMLNITDSDDVVVENFGKGADVSKEIAVATSGLWDVTTCNPGDRPKSDDEKALYLNLRAANYMKGRTWLMSGGTIYDPNKVLRKDLLNNRFKRRLDGKMQMMPKDQMKKDYNVPSPDNSDAYSLTFMRDLSEDSGPLIIDDGFDDDDFDPHSMF